MSDAQEAEYLRAHRSLDEPFPFAFPVPRFQMVVPLGEDIELPESQIYEPSSLADLAPSSSGPLRYTDQNLTYQFDAAEVEISLHPFGTDDLLLPAALLAQHSHWFEASLSSRWRSSGQHAHEAECGALGPRIRYELVFEEDGGSCLLRKDKPTHWLERLNADNTVLHAYAMARDGEQETEYSLIRLDMDQDLERLEHLPCDSLRRTIIESYKVGFALMLHIPLAMEKLEYRPEEREFVDDDDDGSYYPYYSDLYELRGPCRSWTMILIKVVEFAEFFSTASIMSLAIETLVQKVIANSREKQNLKRYAGQYLRIATVIRSKAVFREACVLACKRGDLATTVRGIENNPLLHSIVLTTQLRLQRAVETVMRKLHQPEEYCTWREIDESSSHSEKISADIGYKAWQCWLTEQETEHEESERLQPWGARQQQVRSILEGIIAGRVNSIHIVNKYMNNSTDVLADMPREIAYRVVDYIVRVAIKYAKTILFVGGPGYIPRDWRLNGVDFSPEVFTYPWQTVPEHHEDRVSGPRLGVFVGHSLGQNNLEAKEVS